MTFEVEFAISGRTCHVKSLRLGEGPLVARRRLVVLVDDLKTGRVVRMVQNGSGQHCDVMIVLNWDHIVGVYPA